MKKITISLACLFSIAIGIIAWNLYHYKHGSFKLEPKADFYLIYPDHIESYELTGNQTSLLSSQKLPNEDYFGSGANFSLEDNTLVYSDEGYKFSIGTIVTIDFDRGKIHRQPSKYATLISGSDGRYFYTAGVFDKVVQFDSQLKLVNEADLPEFFNPTGNIQVDQEMIYLVGTENNPDDPENWKNQLVWIDKKSMKLAGSLHLDRKMTVQEGYLLNGILYLPIIANTADDYTMSESKQVLTFDTRTKKFATIDLENPAPTRIYPLNSSHTILIEHDGYTTEDIRFTIYDTKTDQESIHVFPDIMYDYPAISHLEALDDERLLFIVGDQLYLYNWKTKTILNQLTLPSEYLTGMWMQK
ncbi:TPA: hypothetical protein ACGO3A_001748 [Streptococcus suis]